jgi:hypothetical protein
MPNEQIDATALAVPAVAHLGPHDPPPALQARLPRRREPRMMFIEEPVEVRPAPERADFEARLEGAKDAPQDIQGQPPSAAPFEEADGRPMDSSSPRHVGLSHRQPPSDGADDQTEFDVVHRGIMRYGSLPAAYSAPGSPDERPKGQNVGLISARRFRPPGPMHPIPNPRSVIASAGRQEILSPVEC